MWGFVVYFDADNGTITTEVVTASSKATEPVRPEKLFPSESALYEGTVINFIYTFDGWYKDDVIWNFDNTITEPVTIKAKWVSGGGTTAVDLSGAIGETIVDKAFDYVNANPNACEYTLLVAQDISIAGDNSRGLHQSNARLTLIGAGERKLSLNSQGRMFTAGASGQTGIELTFGNNITLVGLDSQKGTSLYNNECLIVIQEDAALTMQDNASVTGNYGETAAGWLSSSRAASPCRTMPRCRVIFHLWKAAGCILLEAFSALQAVRCTGMIQGYSQTLSTIITVLV